MTILEAIKKAEEKQKVLGECAKVYIRECNWNNKFIDPTDFTWVNISSNLGESHYTFNKTSTKFCPNKNDMTNNYWDLFTHYLDLKENKEAKPESASITKENVINAIEQIVLIKKELNELSKDTAKIIKMFEDNYGISIDYLAKNPKILIDKESAILYLFAEFTRVLTKNINIHLNKAIIELGKTEQRKDEK